MKARHAAPSNHRGRKKAVAVISAGLLALTISGAAYAGEIGSGGGGGGGGGTAVCNPVTSLSVKSDARAGETGLATIDVSYGVKPCVQNQAVTVKTKVAEYLNPAVIAYDNPTASPNGKFTVFGVKVRTTYKVTVDVYDTSTGALAGTLSAFTAAIPKGV